MKKSFALFASVLTMTLLILDAKNVANSAYNGIEICIKTVIPSLFPFFYISGYISNGIQGLRPKGLKFLRQICKLEEGTDAIFILGLVSGYPVGAANISCLYTSGYISKSQAERMLGFCNNAGPSFIFGILSGIFENKSVCWVLWCIQIISAILTGALLPRTDRRITVRMKPNSLSSTKALQSAMRSISSVCCWMILFRAMYEFCERWFLWALPKSVQILLCGLIELTNGCLYLTELPSQAHRFLLCAAFLSFGGFCVSMQTASCIGELSLKKYYYGKLIQTSLSLLLAGIAQHFIFSNAAVCRSVWLYIPGLLIILIETCKKTTIFSRYKWYCK